MSLPTEGDEYTKLMEHLRKGQEACAMLSHLTGLNDRPTVSKGWLMVSEMLKKMQHTVTDIAVGKFQ